MPVDADLLQKSLGPPEVTIDGVTYVGKFLSIFEWAPMEKLLHEYQSGVQDSGAQNSMRLEKLIRRFCDIAFPMRLWDVIRLKKSVADRILALPPAILLEVAQDFFTAQQRAINPDLAKEWMEEHHQQQDPDHSRPDRSASHTKLVVS